MYTFYFSQAGVLRRFAVLAVFVAGCSSGDGNANQPASGQVGSPDFAHAFAEAYCGSISSCCSKAKLDTASCAPTLEERMSAYVRTGLGDPNVLYDPDAAGHCIEATRAANVACTDEALLLAASDECKAMFKGTLKPGDKCTAARQCAAIGGVPARCDTGICAAEPADRPVAHAGEPCGASCDRFGGGTSCTGIGGSSPAACWAEDNVFCSASGVCEVSPAIGQPCALATPCVMGAHCAETKVCVANTADGPCASSQDCTSGATCDNATKHCAPLKPDGVACGSDSECRGGVCATGSCRTWSVADARACAGDPG